MASAARGRVETPRWNSSRYPGVGRGGTVQSDSCRRFESNVARKPQRATARAVTRWLPWLRGLDLQNATGCKRRTGSTLFDGDLRTSRDRPGLPCLNVCPRPRRARLRMTRPGPSDGVPALARGRDGHSPEDPDGRVPENACVGAAFRRDARHQRRTHRSTAMAEYPGMCPEPPRFAKMSGVGCRAPSTSTAAAIAWVPVGHFLRDPSRHLWRGDTGAVHRDDGSAARTGRQHPVTRHRQFAPRGYIGPHSRPQREPARRIGRRCEIATPAPSDDHGRAARCDAVDGTVSLDVRRYDVVFGELALGVEALVGRIVEPRLSAPNRIAEGRVVTPNPAVDPQRSRAHVLHGDLPCAGRRHRRRGRIKGRRRRQRHGDLDTTPSSQVSPDISP